MQTGTTIFWLGFILILIPFLGVPLLWQKVAVVVAGALLLVLGYRQRRRDFLRSLQETGGEFHADTYVETTTSLFRRSKED